ncbi:hypothetical protein M9434_005594 [Picochlorum sp. BPE23]|nr:hypothetical protein M9434_005594 [Picochlorum sp. BPE23]
MRVQQLGIFWVVFCGAVAAAATTPEFAIAKDYVITFWPLWLSVKQWEKFPTNSLFGPDEITPEFHSVVAINVDTLYGATIVDLSKGPLVLTVPDTDVGYSVILADSFGTYLDTGDLKNHKAGEYGGGGTYLLKGPMAGEAPGGGGYDVVNVPYNHTMLIFRADVSLPDGTSILEKTNAFRRGLKLANLTEYENNAEAGGLQIVSVELFSTPYKSIADNMVQLAPIMYLKQLQESVKSKFIPPLTPMEQSVSDQFDAAFDARTNDGEFQKGAIAGYNALLENYLTNTDGNGWIHFTDMGDWGNDTLNRASTTEFIQWGNTMETAAYYHTFVDGDGIALTGGNDAVYLLKFSPEDIPPVGRFWSVTAYTPYTVELIPNDANKYHVASYTQGLETDSDGGVTIYISKTRPVGVPEANWLPVSGSKFNIILRVYGVVEGSNVAENTYVPPAIVLMSK